MRLVRALSWFAIAAQVLFVAAWVVAGALEDGYSHLDHHVSELGADGAANPAIVNAAIVVLGASIAALAPALLRALPARRASRVAAALFLLAGLAIVVGGLFNADCSSAVDATCQERWNEWEVDTAAKIHAWASLAAQLLLLATPFTLARALWNHPAAAPTLVAGVAGLAVAAGVTLLFAVDHAPDGLTQRLGLTALHAWVVIVAVALLWSTRREPEPPPATPLRPSDFFASAWAGEGEIVPWPHFVWRRFPQRLRVRRDTTFLSDEAWYFDDRAWREDGTLVDERRVFCTLVAPDRVRVTSDPLLDGTEILLTEDGYRIAPYRVTVAVGPVHFGLSVRDSATVEDGTLVNRLRVSWFGLPVAGAGGGARAGGAARATGAEGLGRCQALGHLLPVDRVPPGVDVVGAPVLVLQVVGVLPHVDAEERRLPVGDRVVLVRGRHDRESRTVMHEPRPARAELADAGVLHLALEVVEGAEGVPDRSRQVAVGLAAPVRRHRLPEERVVEVAAAVVADRGALLLGDLGEVRDDLLDRLVGEVGALERGVRLVHIRLVVLVVVDLHRLRVDVGLERRLLVWQGRDLVGHWGSSESEVVRSETTGTCSRASCGSQAP
jgi:hypothetical protein